MRVLVVVAKKFEYIKTCSHIITIDEVEKKLDGAMIVLIQLLKTLDKVEFQELNRRYVAIHGVILEGHQAKGNLYHDVNLNMQYRIIKETEVIYLQNKSE